MKVSVKFHCPGAGIFRAGALYAWRNCYIFKVKSKRLALCPSRRSRPFLFVTVDNALLPQMNIAMGIRGCRVRTVEQIIPRVINSDKLKLCEYHPNRDLEDKWVKMFTEGLEAELYIGGKNNGGS